MKHQIKSAAIIGIATVFATSAVAYAVTSPASTDAATSSTTPTTTSSTLEQRLSLRKIAQKTKLDAANSARIASKCKAAQVLVAASKARTQVNINKRTEVYTKLSANLKILNDKLYKQGIDVTSLSAIQTQLDTKVTKYKTDVDLYSQTIDDLGVMDCAADPTGFKATLETLRSDRVQLGKDAADIKTLQPQLNKALSDIKLALASSSSNKAGGSN